MHAGMSLVGRGRGGVAMTPEMMPPALGSMNMPPHLQATSREDDHLRDQFVSSTPKSRSIGVACPHHAE